MAAGKQKSGDVLSEIVTHVVNAVADPDLQGAAGLTALLQNNVEVLQDNPLLLFLTGGAIYLANSKAKQNKELNDGSSK